MHLVAERRRSARERLRRAGVLALGRRCEWHAGHAAQVARLARRIFRQLSPEGLMPGPAEEWLEYGALLHDIGYIIGVKGHHKHAERLIREAELPGLLPHEVHIIALMARFHRKRWPGRTHAAFSGVGDAVYRTVRWLTAILRVADALDRTHRSLVREVIVRRQMHHLELGLVVTGNPEEEIRVAAKKGDLLEAVVGSPLQIRVIAHAKGIPGEWNDGGIA